MGGCPHQNLQQDGEHSIEEGKEILKQTQKLTEGALHQGGAQSTALGQCLPTSTLPVGTMFQGSPTQQAAEALPCHTQGATLHVSVSLPSLKVQQN